MKLRPPVIDYRKLRPSNITSPEFRHVLLLLYWIVYLLAFVLIERLTPAAEHYAVHSRLDDLIPFCEWFLFAYFSWMVSLVWISLYTLAYDIGAFRRFMYNLIITTALTIVIYIIWPNQQLLRPNILESGEVVPLWEALGRNSPLIWIVNIVYTVDTNTNVCPSLHCIGAFVVLAAAMDIPRFRTWKWRSFFWVFALLICASTVFMKQHSILDFFAAIPLALLGYTLVYVLPRLKKAK